MKAGRTLSFSKLGILSCCSGGCRYCRPCWEAYLFAEDLLEHDPQLKHRHFYWKVDHPEVGTYRAPGLAFELSKVPSEVRRAPLLGEHNEYALKEIIGMSDEEISELVIEGVLE